MRRVLAAVILLGACGDPPVDRNAAAGYPNHNNPLGRIEGTIVYEGPPPAVDDTGRPVGRVVLLLFRADAPPPPQGFATTALGVATLPASQLFASLSPAATPGRVRASAAFTFPAIAAAGFYQLRAYYSARPDGQGFQPLFSVRNQPWRGDVAGGALSDANPTNPVFQTIPVGRGRADGTLELPDEGAVTSGVTVVLGSPVESDRPVFHVAPSGNTLSAAPIERPPAAGPSFAEWADRTGLLAPSAPADAVSGQATRALVFPSNVGTADPAMFLGAMPSLTLRGGLPENELRGASAAGVVFTNPVPFQIGTPYRAQHPTLIGVTAAGPLRVPWVFPLVLLVRLQGVGVAERAVLGATTLDPALTQRAAAELSTPGSPQLVIFGSVVPDTGLQDFASIVRPPPAPPVAQAAVRVVFPPIAFEVRGADPARDWPAVVPRLPAPLAQATAGMFPPGSRCATAGLPTGRYGLYVVTARGQGWSVPNELAPSALRQGFAVSQGVVVRVESSPAVAGTECPPGLPSSP
jgi:hypothetical protein